MKVRILHALTYSDFATGGKVGARKRAEGEVVDFPGWYARSLIKSGHAEAEVEVKAEVEAKGEVKAEVEAEVEAEAEVKEQLEGPTDEAKLTQVTPPKRKRKK